MAQLIIRNIEDEVKARLQRQAKRHGRSMEQEAREILRNALYRESCPVDGLGTEITALFANIGLDADIAELHGHSIKAVQLD